MLCIPPTRRYPQAFSHARRTGRFPGNSCPSCVSAEVYVHAGSRQLLQLARLVVEDEDRLAQVESAGRISSAAIFCKLHLL